MVYSLKMKYLSNHGKAHATVPIPKTQGEKNLTDVNCVCASDKFYLCFGKE